MPGIVAGLDKLGVRFTGTESTEDKVRLLQAAQEDFKRYLMYALNNLDFRNFSEGGLDELTDPINRRLEDQDGNILELSMEAKALLLRLQNAEGDITQLGVTAQGLQAQISDAEGNITALQATAQGLAARISDSEGNITQLQATAQGLGAQISSAQGDITTLQATANGLGAQISNVEGDITSLQATAQGLAGRISNAEGDITSLQATANGLGAQISNVEGDITSLQATAQGLSSRISNAEGDITALTQTVDSITLSVDNGESSSWVNLMVDGIEVASERIRFTGMVSFADLEDPDSGTVIDGGLILTDNMMLDTLYGDTIYLMDGYGDPAARFSITGAASYQGGALDILTGALRLETFGGDIYMENDVGTSFTLSGDVASFGGDVIPRRDSYYWLGTNAFSWEDLYVVNEPTVVSDREKKFDIDYDLSGFNGLFDTLRPCSFRRTDGDSMRLHMGLIAQDVEAARDAAGIPSSELAALVRSEDGQGQNYALRYGEFIGLCIDQIQKLKKRVEALEGQKG